MIVFLFGTWGSGKSFVGNLIQRECGLLHVEADVQFNKRMLNALHARTFHELDLSAYYNQVVTDIFSFQKRANDFIVSQGIYQGRFRRLIFDVFQPDIRFVWVKTENHKIQKLRLNRRSELTGNPITGEVLDYMQAYWEDPQIPHEVLLNGPLVEDHGRKMLQSWGLCLGWEG